MLSLQIFVIVVFVAVVRPVYLLEYKPFIIGINVYSQEACNLPVFSRCLV
jgi:hypothetical protein